MKPILKGKLTKISAALYALAKSPELLADIYKTADTYNEASDQPLSYLAFVAALGVVWGGIRRAFNYFGK